MLLNIFLRFFNPPECAPNSATQFCIIIFVIIFHCRMFPSPSPCHRHPFKPPLFYLTHLKVCRIHKPQRVSGASSGASRRWETEQRLMLRGTTAISTSSWGAAHEDVSASCAQPACDKKRSICYPVPEPRARWKYQTDKPESFNVKLCQDPSLVGTTLKDIKPGNKVSSHYTLICGVTSMNNKSQVTYINVLKTSKKHTRMAPRSFEVSLPCVWAIRLICDI